MRRPTSLAQAAVATSVAVTQSIGSAFSGNNFCNHTFSDANATGLYWFTPGVAQGAQPQQRNDTGVAHPAAWAITLDETLFATNVTDKGLGVQLWYSTGGANYSDDLSLGYDVCALSIDNPLLNTVYRGQSDNGDCLTMFDQPCIGALKAAANQYVEELVLDPTPEPNSNLTSTSLPTVCTDLSNMLQANFPQECSVFLNGSAHMSGMALTAPNSSIGLLNSAGGDCRLNRTFQQVDSRFYPGDMGTEQYQKLTLAVLPLLTVFLPVANAARQFSITHPNTIATCARFDTFNPGSEGPFPFPSPTPVSTAGGGLRGGAIAGIVIGAVVGAGLIAGLAFWLWRRKRKAHQAAWSEKSLSQDTTPETEPEPVPERMELAPSPIVEASADAQINEMNSLQVRAELAMRRSTGRFELATHEHRDSMTKNMDEPPVELEAGYPNQ